MQKIATMDEIWEAFTMSVNMFSQSIHAKDPKSHSLTLAGDVHGTVNVYGTEYNENEKRWSFFQCDFHGYNHCHIGSVRLLL